MEKLHEIPAEYEEAINSVIGKFANLNQPRYKGYIKIVVRPQGLRSSMSEEMYCIDRDQNSHQKIFDRFCLLLQKAKRFFGEKDFVFEIFNTKGNSLLKIRVDVSKKIHAVMNSASSALPLPTAFKAVSMPHRPAVKPRRVTVSVPQPETAEKPTPAALSVQDSAPAVEQHASVPEHAPVLEQTAPVAQISARPPDPVPAVEERPPSPCDPIDAPAQEPALNGVSKFTSCPEPDAEINFVSMKFFPTEATHRNIQKVFGICGIRTNRDILECLGTTEPTRADWEIFINSLRTKATSAGAKLWPSSDGTLYWWLSKKMGWIQPFPVINKDKA